MSEKNIFKYLLLVLTAAISFILIKELIFKEKLPDFTTKPLLFPEVDLTIETIENLETADLSAVEGISLPENVGRFNPFEPY